MKARSKTISFRLQAEEEELLSTRAGRFGVSKHDLSRLYVLEMLGQGEERQVLREAVTALNNEISSLRKDVSLSAQALLSSAGKVSEEKARKWAEENLNPE